ncbi:allophanate hydrolase [Micractinium conductrix]|uniref:Allophanate hydrolase n=1 Tax=Micractinium conductrix TaxID=554055 RepID=A0A2P6V6A7_9CHLO|nr:allophanate hydrolase [Micractinium conductrix]|eukprot:PSC69624.1 allophanate hydrolase [Micractinium conductrix]
MPLTTEQLTLPALRAAYAAAALTPMEVVRQLLPAIQASRSVFISRPTEEQLLERCRFLEGLPADQRGPLWGIPFAVKDNIDVAGLPTTATCPAFEYTPAEHARAVAPLLEAGGICLGKTNMDQFACGLVGTRTPYGIPRNAFDDRFTPGGSSCGSAIAVADGLCTFALGTDTAGSGRVPAGNNGIVGIKPSVGRFSTTGVVPACYLLDCVSVFVLSVRDGAEVARIMENGDIADPTYRLPNPTALAKRWQPGGAFRFAVPGPAFLDDSFEGPGGEAVRAAMEAAWQEAVARLEALGGVRVPDLDFAPFAATAVLLYGAAFVAERYAGIKAFLEAPEAGGVAAGPAALAPLHGDDRMLKVIRSIISKTANFSSADVFAGLQQLSVLRGKCRAELAKVDLIVVPTSAYNYTVKEIQAEEDEPPYEQVTFGKNANLGRWTNFVNLQDMCGVSVYSGLLRPCGPLEGDAPEQRRRAEHLAATGNTSPVMPFGVTLLAPSWTDEYVADIAAAFEKATGLKAGPLGHGVAPYRSPQAPATA